MTLTRVTITGADDGVEPTALLGLSQRYPFVEWGILCSESRAGQRRYPSLEWQAALSNARMHGGSPSGRYAAHLCGALARRLMGGDRGVYASLVFRPERIQLNGFERQSPPLLQLIDAFDEVEWILQVRDRAARDEAAEVIEALWCSPSRVTVLYDESGGRGVARVTPWPPPIEFEEVRVPTGRAGGIGLLNIEQEAAAAAATDYKIWLDLESGARTPQDRFNLDLVEGLLARAAPHVT